MKVRDAVMDRHCGTAGDYLEQINAGRQGLESVRSAALRHMAAKGLSFYKARGVEFAVVPGDVKCRVRLAKGGGDAAEKAAPAGQPHIVAPPALEDDDEDLLDGAIDDTGNDDTDDNDLQLD